MICGIVPFVFQTIQKRKIFLENNSCNNFNGTYKSKAKGKIGLVHWFKTKMGCPDSNIDAGIYGALNRSN